jgi:hypothetical protein
MKPKDFILELFRETDFLYETLDWRKLEKSEDGESLRSALGNLRRACSAYLNGQDVEDAVARFRRAQLEADVYEELEIWGKFSPPPQIIDHGSSVRDD